MDTMSAFFRGQASRGNQLKVFDWDRAAQIIRRAGATEASAGLSGDWEYTGGRIFADGKPIPQDETYVYLASTWATPELEVNGETHDCWRYESETDGWDAHTYWPESARALLSA
jgi:hypothetical protein